MTLAEFAWVSRLLMLNDEGRGISNPDIFTVYEYTIPLALDRQETC
jgi:hypothetical protein